jgi:hypothetical protein
LDRHDRVALARSASFFGNWNHVYQRFAYWCDKGHFEAIFNALKKPDIKRTIFWIFWNHDPNKIGPLALAINNLVSAIEHKEVVFQSPY